MKPYKNIDEYIDNYTPDVQEILKRIRKISKEIVPDGEEVISYGIPTIKLNGKYVVYFAAFAKYISIYPVIHDDPKLSKKLETYRAGRGTLHFPLDKPIPYDLIKEIIKSLLIENLKRTAKY